MVGGVGLPDSIPLGEPGSSFTASRVVSVPRAGAHGTPSPTPWLAAKPSAVLQAGGTREDWSGAAEQRVQAVHHARGGLPVGAA